MSAKVEMLPIFYANRSNRGEPSGYISLSGARDLVSTGLAEWTNNKCKSIRLNKTEAELAPHALSLTMGPNVIEGNADGEESFMALVEGWRPQYAIAA